MKEEIYVHRSWHVHYEEAILNIGNWSLRRKGDNAIPTSYRAMIGHMCPLADGYHLRNGERNPWCKGCGEFVPDEIWGLWQLLCNDQRRGER